MRDHTEPSRIIGLYQRSQPTETCRGVDKLICIKHKTKVLDVSFAALLLEEEAAKDPLKRPVAIGNQLDFLAPLPLDMDAELKQQGLRYNF